MNKTFLSQKLILKLVSVLSAILFGLGQQTHSNVALSQNTGRTGVLDKGGNGLIQSGITTNTMGADGEFDQHYQLSHYYLMRADLNLATLEIEQAIAVKPSSKVAHRFYCLISLLRFNIPQVIAEFMMTVGLGQSIPLTSKEHYELNIDCAQAHYRKGLKFETQSAFKRAILEFSLANYYAPKNVLIYRSMAFSLGKLGRFAQAEQFYQDSFVLSPVTNAEDAYARADYAYLLADMGRKDEAISQLSKAVKIAPTVAALHVDLATFLESKGELEQATKEMELAIKTAPNHANVTPAVGKAYSQFGTKIRRPPSYANLWEQLARLQDKQNKLAQAKDTYQYVLLLDPQEPEVKARLNELKSTNPPQYSASTVTKGMDVKSRVK